MMDLSKNLENVPVLVEESSAASRTFPRFQYSPDNVQGPGCPVDPSEVTLPGCSCRSRSCVPESCSCLRNAGGKDPAYCTPVFECNVLCSCSGSCSTRRVQVGLGLRLEVFGTERRGWGVRTLQSIPRGGFVCEYAGEVIGSEEARRRQLAQRPEDNNYIIAVREHAGRGHVTQTFVDPAAVGNVGRFLNHSCSPNLLMVPVRVHSVVPRLALFAVRDIRPREELTFDYSGGDANRPPADPPAVQTSRSHVERKACYCGAKNCSGFLPLDPSVLS